MSEVLAYKGRLETLLDDIKKNICNNTKERRLA